MFRYFSRAFSGKRRGQTMTEYAIIVALVAVASIAVVTVFGKQLRTVYAFMAKRIAGHHENPTDYTGEVLDKIGAEMDDWPVQRND